MAFAPTDISGLNFWLKADAGLYQERTGASATTPASADSDPVGTWLDQSGQANHVVASANSKRPTLKLSVQNGRSVVRFDGVDDCLKLSAFGVALSQPHTMFIVFKFADPSVASKILYDARSGAGGGGNYIDTSSADVVKIYCGLAEVSISITTSSFGILMVVPNGASSKARANGGSEATLASSPGTNTANGMTLGAAANETSAVCACDIGEALLFSGNLAAGDKDSMFSYLNSRWGVY